MSNLVDELYEDIRKYVIRNSGDIVYEIAKEFDDDRSSYEYEYFAPDGLLEFCDLYDTDEHFCRVMASCKVEEGYIIGSGNESEPDATDYECTFIFFIDRSDDGILSYDFYRDENGRIDLIKTIQEPDGPGDM